MSKGQGAHFRSNALYAGLIESQYAERLVSLWTLEASSIRNRRLRDGRRSRRQRRAPAASPAALRETEAQNNIKRPSTRGSHLKISSSVNPTNWRLPQRGAAAEAETAPYNPLFLYSGVGLGKTHLMHAIAWHIRQTRPEKRAVYLSAEKFMYQFIRALRFRDTVAFKEQFRSVDVLMIDDVQFIAGKDSTQEEFFHTFNALVDQKQIVISADKSPNDLEGMEERMKSRLGWGLVADIHPTTYELRYGILQAKADELKIDIPPKILEFLAHKITSNVRELEGALNRIVAYANLVGRPITLETTQDVLHDVLRANDRKVTIEEIIKNASRSISIFACRKCIRRVAPAPWPARARSRCIWQSN